MEKPALKTVLHESFRDMGGPVLGGGRGGGHKFRDMGGAVSKYAYLQRDKVHLFFTI